MSSFGVVASGFAAMDQDGVLADMQDKLRAKGRNALADQAGYPDSLIGNVVGTQAMTQAELWQVMLTVYNSIDPDTATGTTLDKIGRLRGVIRDAAYESTVTLTVTLAAYTTLPAGNVVSHATDPTIRFVTTEDVSSTTAGTYTVSAESEYTGPYAAGIGELTVIDTPYTGWSAVTNLAAATAGADREDDETYRTRIIGLPVTTRYGTLDGIRAALLLDEGITQARVFQNTTAVTDADGLPPHSIEAVVDGPDVDGTDAQSRIAQILFNTVGAGIGTYSTDDGITGLSGTALDADENEYTMYYSLPTPVNVAIVVVVATDPATFPADGFDQIDDAITAYFQALPFGEDVIRTRLFGVIFGISGVVDVTTLTLNAGTSNITTTSREIATISSLGVS